MGKEEVKDNDCKSIYSLRHDHRRWWAIISHGHLFNSNVIWVVRETTVHCQLILHPTMYSWYWSDGLVPFHVGAIQRAQLWSLTKTAGWQRSSTWWAHWGPYLHTMQSARVSINYEPCPTPNPMLQSISASADEFLQFCSEVLARLIGLRFHTSSINQSLVENSINWHPDLTNLTGCCGDCFTTIIAVYTHSTFMNKTLLITLEVNAPSQY